MSIQTFITVSNVLKMSVFLNNLMKYEMNQIVADMHKTI